MKYLLNGFSPKMLDTNDHIIKFEKCSRYEFIRNKKDCINAIGHRSISDQLNLKQNRMQIQLEKGDTAYIVSSKKQRRNLDYPDLHLSNNLTYQKLTVVE